MGNQVMEKGTKGVIALAMLYLSIAISYTPVNADGIYQWRDENGKTPFAEYDVETSEKGRRDYKKMGGTGVPIILVGQRRMNGFSEEGFRAFYSSRIE